MSKWFEKEHEGSSNIMYSRIRLARNWEAFPFPSRLDRDESSRLVDSLKDGLSELRDGSGEPLGYRSLEEIKSADRIALRERRILNRAAVEKTGAAGLFLSEDESESLVLGVDDHIRLQLLAPGLSLEQLWKRADQIDDEINQHFSYAFDEKYGYLTAFPTMLQQLCRKCKDLRSNTRSFGHTEGSGGCSAQGQATH